MSSLKSHTFQAFLATLAAIAAGVLAQRWGVQVPPGALEALGASFVAYVVGRQYKSTKLEAAAQAAKAGIEGLDTSELAQAVAPIVQAELAKVGAKVTPPAPEAPPKPAGGALPALIIAAVLGAVTMSSCAFFQKPKVHDDLQKCASGFVGSEVQAAMPEVLGAIQGRSADWQAQLDGVLVRLGTAGVCALMAIISGLEGGTGGSPGAMPVVLLAPDQGGLPPAVVLLRGYAYLDSRR